MKNTITLFLVIFGFLNGYAQLTDKLFVELDIYRETHEDEIYDFALSLRNSTFINGFRVGYQKNDKLDFTVGIRRASWEKDYSTGFGGMDFTVNGFEINFGISYKIFETKILRIYGGAELFHEKFKYLGKGTSDAGISPYEIDYNKNFSGAAKKLKLDIKIIENIYLTAESRYRFGLEYYTNSNNSVLNNYSNWIQQLTLIHMVGLKFEI